MASCPGKVKGTLSPLLLSRQVPPFIQLSAVQPAWLSWGPGWWAHLAWGGLCTGSVGPTAGGELHSILPRLA